MKFHVTELKMMDQDNGKVTLESRQDPTFYTSMLFLHVPVADLPLYPFGKELELELPQAAEVKIGGMPRSDWKHFETAHLEAGTRVNDREY